MDFWWVRSPRKNAEKATYRNLGNTNIEGSGRRNDALEEN